MRQFANRIRSILKPGRPDRQTRRRPERLTTDQHETLQRNLAALLRSKEYLTQVAHESRG